MLRQLGVNPTYLLKLGDGLGSSEDPLGSVGSHLGGLAVCATPEELIELCDEQLISAAQVVADSHAERQVAVVECLLEIFH